MRIVFILDGSREVNSDTRPATSPGSPDVTLQKGDCTMGSSDHILVIFTECLAGKEEEFNRWYD